MPRHSVKAHSSKHSKIDLVASNRFSLAKLLATLPSDRRKWDDDTVFRLANFERSPLFFCPVMRTLSPRGKAIEAVLKKNKTVPSINPRDFKSLVSGRPLTLEKIVGVQSALEAIARSRDPAVRQLTKVKRAARLRPLTLGENDVVPSLYWVNKPLVTQFRDHYGIKRRPLSEIILGTDDASSRIMVDLDEGFAKGEHAYDYRVTRFTCDYIYCALSALFDRLTHYRRPPFTVMPPWSHFFVLSHTAGPGRGRRTEALAISKGNQMALLTKSQERKIAARADAYAKSVGL